MFRKARVDARPLVSPEENDAVRESGSSPSAHRTNFPQIRANLDDPQTLELAKCFGAPIAIHAKTRDGSLRQAATEAGATVLLFEGGEAMRFDPQAIETGRDGALRVLGQLGIIEGTEPAAKQTLLSRRCHGFEHRRAASSTHRLTSAAWSARVTRSPRFSMRMDGGSVE